MRMARTVTIAVVVLCLLEVIGLHATIFGTVRGIVHDSQHLPVVGATVTLKAQDADWAQVQKKIANEDFEFTTVPTATTTLTGEKEGSRQQQQGFLVEPSASQVLHFDSI